jgi:hypothetical protein
MVVPEKTERRVERVGVVAGEAPFRGVTIRGDQQWGYFRALVAKVFQEWEKSGRRIVGDREEVAEDCMVAAYLAATEYDGPENLIAVLAATVSTGRTVREYVTWEEYLRGEANHTCRGGKIIKRRIVATALGEDRKPLVVPARNLIAKRAVRVLLRAEKWGRENGREVLSAQDAEEAQDREALTLDEELEVRYLIKRLRVWFTECYPSLPKNEREALADLTIRPIAALGGKARWKALQSLKARLIKAGVVILSPEEEGEIMRAEEAEKTRNRERKARAYRRRQEEAKVAEAFREAFGARTRDREREVATATA